MSLKQKIKKIVPFEIWEKMHLWRLARIESPVIKAFNQNYDKVKNRIRNAKKPIRVVFFAIYHSNWKYDSLIRLMLSDSSFEPLVLICPTVVRDKEHELKSRQECVDYFTLKHIPFVCAYDVESDTYLDPHTLNPDIIFFTNPYRGLVHPDYYIDKFDDVLTCYVSYAFNNVPFKWSVASLFHQIVWRYFVECDENYRLIRKLTSNKAKNCRITGYPLYDSFMSQIPSYYDWKIKDKKIKRIIWAPHHTVSNHLELLHLSTFERYADFFLELAMKYKDSVQFIFKPHPLLKSNLYTLSGWGKLRTEAYYKKWSEGENTNINEGDYIDLFLSSDALIHDCGSFTVEYLYTQKPALYLDNQTRLSQSNEIGKMAFGVHYHATDEEQITSFIDEVILGNHDYKAKERNVFFQNHLLPPNGCSVAENIINEIKKELC